MNYEEIFHSDIKYYGFNSVNYLGDKKGYYFSAKDGEIKSLNNLIIKFSLNSKNEIAFDKDYLPIHNVKDYKFLTGNKLFIELINKKYVVYDLNYKQVEIAFEYKENNCLKNIFKGIKSINKCLLKDFIYETNKPNYFQFNCFYVLKRNNNEIYFIGKYRFSKIFKYTYMKEEYNNFTSQINKDFYQKLFYIITWIITIELLFITMLIIDSFIK